MKKNTINTRGRCENLTMAGRGRVKGQPNRYTLLKQELLGTFEAIGGRAGMVKWAKANRGTFYKLLVSLLPRSVEITGADGEPFAPVKLSVNINIVSPVKQGERLSVINADKTIQASPVKITEEGGK